jgi:hypothetical protein
VSDPAKNLATNAQINSNTFDVEFVKFRVIRGKMNPVV